MTRRRRKPDYIPTPEQIRMACVQIRAGWSETAEQQRKVGKSEPYEFPVVATADLGRNGRENYAE